MRILLVEDSPQMAETIRQGLAEHGYTVDVARTAAEGKDGAFRDAYEVIILDVMLPDQDGVSLCRDLRRSKVATPILILTVLSETSDKVAALDAGADDYLTKPFEFDELLARIRALMRRRKPTESVVLKLDGLVMDLLKRSVTRDGQKISLTRKEFALLEYFLRNPNHVLTRTAIADRVWDMDLSSDSNVIDVYVSTLRRKIDKPFEKKLLHTVIGTGYVLSEEGPPG